MKKKLIILILAALATCSIFTLTACGDGNNASEIASETSSFEETSSMESSAENSSSEVSAAESELSSETENKENTETNGNTEHQENTTVNHTHHSGENHTNYTSQSNGNSGGSANHQSQYQQPAAQPQPQVHAPIYKQVWVVDKAAWTEEVPVYGNKYIDVCNNCGADVTANPTAHAKEHALKGESSGHHGEVIQVQTGTKTIYHEEQGHYENVLVCGGCTGSH